MIDIQHYSPALKLDSEGIWTAGDTAAVSYPTEDHDTCLAVEDSSFWFGHRNRAIMAIAQRFLPVDSRRPLFDIGGGNGFVACGLAAAGYEVGDRLDRAHDGGTGPVGRTLPAPPRNQVLREFMRTFGCSGRLILRQTTGLRSSSIP